VPATIIGTVLNDRYRITELLGEGGMGVVFRGVHTKIDKEVAIKVLSPTHARDQSVVDRFMREAKTASKIRQENVVDISDFGETEDGLVFLVMEYLHGEDLAEMLAREGAISWPRARQMMLQICAALGAAHGLGVVHRDMKPANCFRTTRRGNDDFISVLDFGIAKVTNLNASTAENRLTQTGAVMGTATYMSPEQARAEPLDARTDIYSVGVILYEMLTGQVPFHAGSFMAVMTAHLLDPPPPPRSIVPSIDPRVEAVVLKCLDKDPSRRYQTMEELAAAMAHVETATYPLAPVETTGGSAAKWVALGVAAIGLVGGGFAFALAGGDEDATVSAAPAEPAPAPEQAQPQEPAASEEPAAAPTPASGHSQPEPAPEVAALAGSEDELLLEDEDEDELVEAPPEATTPAVKKASKKPKPRPTTLSLANQKTSMSRLKSAARACGKRSGVLSGMGVKVTVQVTAENGKAAKVTPVAPNRANKLGRCIAAAVKSKAIFVRTQQPTTFAYTFTL
jgi:serine/threonine-protein kinase